MGKKKGYPFTQNFIKNAVGKNYTKAVSVSTHHFNTLTEAAANGDAPAAACLVLFIPKHNTLMDTTTDKGTATGQKKTKVSSVKTLFKQLIDTELPAWENIIISFYPRKSDGYKNFFPGGLAAFQKGKQDDRIEDIRILKETCEADGSHGVVNTQLATSIDTFYTAILAARAAAIGKKGTVKTDAGNQLIAINDMCVAHFANVGTLIAAYPDNTEKINSFINITALQSHHHSVEYKGSLNPDELKKALTHKFTAASTIVVNNRGDADFLLYVTEGAKDKVHPAGIVVPAHAELVVILVKNVSGDAKHRILMIKNLSATTPASYEIFVGDTRTGVTTDPHD
jgi:hypothetical protein